jgi:crotonobetainyl-CoA:carnitine CoA-transferase CaiB-like acyl-CoA transferase
VAHPTEGDIRLIGFPAHSSTDATRLVRLPPLLGQHSREVLEEAGISTADVDALVSAGNVIDASLQ